jgi:hypothetical protein
MEPIPIHSLPLPLVSTSRPQRDQGRAKQDLPGRRPGKDETTENAAEDSAKKNSDQETPRRGSDGIVGTLIDVEA